MRTYDLVGIGLGPANLGLACLAAPLDLDCVFLERRHRFDWHPGMLLESATLQTPFLADLVTLADPTSPYSFLAYLKQSGRLYPFYIRESFFPLRREYDDYCRWAAEQLTSVRFGHHVTAVEHDGDAFTLTALSDTGESVRVRGRHLVLGTGTSPHVPESCKEIGGRALHSATYLDRKAALQSRRSITVVGSGQSAAEVYLDLLGDIDAYGYELNWVTRSPRFFPLEYTKLTLELTSPDYVDYFHALPEDTRYRLETEQKGLSKGISSDTVNAVYDLLYQKSLGGPVPTRLVTCTEVRETGYDESARAYDLQLWQWDQERASSLRTEGLVLATGYAYEPPSFLDPVRDRLRWDGRGRLDVARNYSVDVTGRQVFLQNGATHAHSVTSPDLGMCAYRNSYILKELLGHEPYPVEKSIAFQDFGILEGAAP